MPAKDLHVGAVSCVDVKDGGAECVTVGEDGRVNLVGVMGSGLSCHRVFDSDGLVSYTAAKWASPVEFATGGYGFSLQWWDQRKPGGPVSQFKGNWCVIFSFQHYVSCYIIVYIAFKLLICVCMYENWDGTLGKLTVLVIQNLKL